MINKVENEDVLSQSFLDLIIGICIRVSDVYVGKKVGCKQPDPRELQFKNFRSSWIVNAMDANNRDYFIYDHESPR